MTIHELLQQLKAKQKNFKDVLAFIEEGYNYAPSSFQNGLQSNAENENQGSARVLYFAQLNNLSAEDTLILFAEHYDAVLASPEAADHQNIRQFMINGWDGVQFEKTVLSAK